MAAEMATLSEDAVARARSRLHLPTRLKGAGIRRMATVRDAAFISRMNAILLRSLTRNSGTNTPTLGFFDPQLGSVLGRGSFNATSSARQYDHFLNDAHGSDSYAAEMREAWGRLQAATAGHLGDADARQMEREVEAASGSQKELTAFLDQANNSRLRNEVCALPATSMTPHELREVAAGYFFLPSPCLAPVVGSQIILPSTEHNPVTVDLYGDALMNLPAPGDAHWRVQHDAIADAFLDHCVHDLGIAVRREVDDLFQQAVPLGNTVPRDELKDLVPDTELSLLAFNVVTGSYDPRSLKSTLLEFKTMRYGVKYTSVPRATAVDRFERSLLGDIQRGLAARDAAWHNTEPGQKGPLRDIMDMSEYTGMVFGTVGEVSKGVHRTGKLSRSRVECETGWTSRDDRKKARLRGDAKPRLSGVADNEACQHGAAQHDGGPGADAEEAAAEGWAASTQVSMLSARQKRLVLALTAVVAGLIGFPDVLARRAVNSGTAELSIESLVEENRTAGEGQGMRRDAVNDWELHFWEDELAHKAVRKEQRGKTVELSAAVSEAERLSIFVKRRKCVAADLATYKMRYEQQDGLVHCERNGTFGPTCSAHICTARAYLPGNVYIRAERNLDDTFGVWLRARMAVVQQQLRSPDGQQHLDVARGEVHAPELYNLNYKYSVAHNFLSLVHSAGQGVLWSSPLALADAGNRWAKSHDQYLLPPATRCAAASRWREEGTPEISWRAPSGRRLLSKGGHGKKAKVAQPTLRHEPLDAWGCLFRNAAQLAYTASGQREQDGATVASTLEVRSIQAAPPKHASVPEPQPAPAWLGTGMAWREFLRLVGNSSSASRGRRDVWLPAQVAEFLWQPSEEVLSIAEAVSKLSNYTGPRFLGRAWQPGSAKEMEAHWVDPVDRFQYAWPLRPVIGVVAMGADFGEECVDREYKAACRQWMSKVGGKTTMQEGLQRYQQELWQAGLNPAKIGPDSVISECYAGGGKGEVKRRAARRIAARKCPAQTLVQAIHELKLKYGAQIIHLVTDALDIANKFKAMTGNGKPLEGCDIRNLTLSGKPGQRPLDDTVGVHLLRQSDMLLGRAEHLELPLLLAIGRTGVVPPFISVDRPPLLQAANGTRVSSAHCTARSCDACGEEAAQRLASPPVPEEWRRHESGHDRSAAYRKLQKLGAMNEAAQGYEVYVSSDHELPQDMPELEWEEEELVPLEDLHPPLPPVLHASKVTATSLRAVWTEPNSFRSPIQRYEAKLSLAPGPRCPAVDYDAGRCVVADVPLERPLFEIDHVAEGQPYLLTVRAENEAGWGNFSEALRMETPVLLTTSPPGLPALVELFHYRDSCSAALRWALPEEDYGQPAEAYEVETRVYGGALHSVVSSEHTAVTVDRLPKGTRFLARVRARNGAGWSEYGPALSFWSQH
eukprot:jgi/Tetstr1/437208/TSEL_025939.t1